MTFEGFTEIAKAAVSAELPGAGVKVEKLEAPESATDKTPVWIVKVDGELLYGFAFHMAVTPLQMNDIMPGLDPAELLREDLRRVLKRRVAKAAAR